MDRAAWIEATLREHFHPVHLEIADESAHHARHPGASGGGHFRVLIVSDRFEGKSLLQRQRAVYDALGTALGTELHAVAMRTWTPKEWTARRELGSRA